jgi:peroxiredoxin
MEEEAIMSLTPSTMLPLGTKAPDFSLPEVVTGKTLSLADFDPYAALLVMFICRHCPFVKHLQEAISRFGRDYTGKNLGIVAISANDAVEYPDDRPESLKEMAESLGFTFPYCYDESQETAKAYDAACTPDFFLFDGERKLVYRGQFDDSRPGNDIPVTGSDLRAAADAVLSGSPILKDQKPSIGCNIKWKTE